MRIDPKLLKEAKKEKPKNIKKAKRVNFSWLYYIDYFKDLNYENLKDKNNENQIKNNKTPPILAYKKEKLRPFEFKNSSKLLLEVDGAGLLIGSGYNHEINDIKGGLNLGLSLDYTTGYPYIPGSSIKGVVIHIIEDKNKKEYLDYLVSKHKLSNKDLEELKTEDIFLDAFPKKFSFTDDYITPHNDLTKNPIPIRFLKIKQGSQFLFQFIFSNNQDKKLAFIKEILLDIGVGAKNNLNFGKFKEVKNG